MILKSHSEGTLVKLCFDGIIEDEANLVLVGATIKTKTLPEYQKVQACGRVSATSTATRCAHADYYGRLKVLEQQ